MKKSIVFCGPMASGKTWTSMGISNFFPNKHIFISKNHILFKPLIEFSPKTQLEKDLRKKLKNIKLIIIDDCVDADEITQFEPVLECFSNINFIFCTQSAFVTKLSLEKYHVVRCSRNAL
jgi:hypothetical protein